MGALLQPLGVHTIPGVLMQRKKQSVAEVLYSRPTHNLRFTFLYTGRHEQNEPLRIGNE